MCHLRKALYGIKNVEGSDGSGKGKLLSTSTFTFLKKSKFKDDKF
jgi:hypothetical protein